MDVKSVLVPVLWNRKQEKKSSLSLLQGVKILFANKYWFIMLMVNIFYTAMTSLYGMNMYFAKYVMQDAVQ